MMTKTDEIKFEDAAEDIHVSVRSPVLQRYIDALRIVADDLQKRYDAEKDDE